MKLSVPTILYSFFFVLLILGARHGADSFWLVHDNLNSETIFKIQPSREGIFFSVSNEQTVDGYIGNIPRNSYSDSPFNIVSWIFHLVPASLAMLLTSLLVRTIAFFGMFKLLHRYFYSQTTDVLTQVTIGLLSLGFAFLPFYSIHGWMIAGLPFFITAIIQITQREKTLLSWFVVCLYCLGSSFVLGGFAVLTVLWSYALWLILKRSAYKWQIAIVAIVSSLLFVLSDIGLFAQFLFDKNYVSHRSEWILSGYNWKTLIYSGGIMFLLGQYHAPSLHLPLLIFILILLVTTWKTSKRRKQIIIGILLLGTIALFHALYKSDYFLGIRNSISFLKAFQLDRFYFLYPVAWVCLFAYVADSLTAWKKYVAISGAFVFVIYVLSNNAEWLSNVSGKSHAGQTAKWNDYYKTEYLNELHRDLPPTKEFRIIHYRMDPAVGAFLGYQTADGYHTNYPVQLKHEFVKLISPMLSSDQEYAENLTVWGSRLYIPKASSDEIQLDMGIVKEKNIRYIFSSTQLNGNDNFELLQKYQHSDDKKATYVYQINY